MQSLIPTTILVIVLSVIALFLVAGLAIVWQRRRSAITSTAHRIASDKLRKVLNIENNAVDPNATLVMIAKAIARGVELTTVLQNAVDIATHLTDAQHGSLLLLDEALAVRHSILSRGHAPRSERQIVLREVLDKGIAGWAAENKEAALIHDTKEDERWLHLPDAPYTVRSVLALPLISQDQVLGILTLQHPAPHHFSEEALTLMQTAADQMALALRNAQTYEIQRRLADRQATLYQVLSTISGHLEPDTVVNTAVSTIAELTGWPALAILVADEKKRRFRVQAVEGLLREATDIEFPLDQGISGRAFRENKTQVVPDLFADPDHFVDHSDLRSSINIPLHRRGRHFGVFVVESDRLNAFDANDIWLAKALAEAIALAMDNAFLFQSITDERSRLRALIQSSRDGIALISVDRRILVMNERAQDFLQLPGEPQDWVSRSVVEALFVLRHKAPESVKTILAEIRRVESGDLETGEGEVRIGPHIYQWLNIPVKAESTPIGRLLVLHDITQERLLEQMREDLTRTTVHDLRNPIGSVHTALDLMASLAQEEGFPRDVVQLLDIAQFNTDKSMKLINNILDISRLESRQMPLEYVTFCPHRLVDDVQRSLHPLANKKDVRLTNEIAEDAPMVWADTTLIERVLQNLLGNAIKFTPAGGAVTIRAEQRETADGHKLFLSVHDTGPGIPPDVQKRLFQKFATGKQQESGSGLGLAFCKMVLEAHQESIWLAEGNGDGATFTFSLPLAHL